MLRYFSSSKDSKNSSPSLKASVAFLMTSTVPVLAFSRKRDGKDDSGIGMLISFAGCIFIASCFVLYMKACENMRGRSDHERLRGINTW
jgi:hypothetical protein